MIKYSNQEILKGLKNRDNEILEYIWHFLPPVIFMVERMGGSKQDAEDIFQEALIAIIYKVDKDKLALTARLSTYIYGICKKMWYMQYHKRKKEEENTHAYLKDVYYPESELVVQEKKEKKFLHYFDKLSHVCKEIIKLYSNKVSVKEIAEELGNTEKYIRKRKYECKNRLIKLIKENDDKIE